MQSLARLPVPSLNSQPLDSLGIKNMTVFYTTKFGMVCYTAGETVTAGKEAQQ